MTLADGDTSGGVDLLKAAGGCGESFDGLSTFIFKVPS